jgi:hypothetical protein
MSSNNSEQQKVEVNGDTSGWQPEVQDQVIMALLRNGGIKRIHETLQQRFDESGWSQNLRDYVTHLLRSGAAKTYGDVEAIVLRRIESGVADPQGQDNGVPAPNLSIPSEAQHAGADAIKREMAAVVKKK